MLPRWTYERAMQASIEGERERDAIKSIADLERRQRAIREGIERCIGGMPGSDTPLNPRTAGTVRGNGFRVEKVIFESRPSVYVTANVYIPDGIREPRGAVLLLCGHREKAKHCDEYQTACHYLVHSGLVVLSVDPTGQGERFNRYDPASKQAGMTSVRDHENAGRQCLPLGDSLARYMLHDAVRAIDYLCTRPEVDPNRIGVTGHSGGGMQTSLVMMYDRRIAAAAPGGFIMNRPWFLLTGKTQDAEQKWPGFSALGFDHEDILLAMAPRPVLVLATTYDSVPIEGPRHTVAVNRRFWELSGHGERIGLAEDANAHRFTVPLIRAAASFFSAHLLGASAVPPDDRIELLPAERLLCTRSGQVIGELEQAKSIYDENAQRLSQLEAARHAMPEGERRSRSIDWLRAAVQAGRQPADPNPRYAGGGEAEGLQVSRIVWWSQRGLLNHALLFAGGRQADCKRPVTIAIWDRGTNSLEPHASWIREVCESGRTAMVLNPTGVGPLLPHLDAPDDDPYKMFGALDKHTDELMWLGDSMAAVRVHDMLRAAEVARGSALLDGENIELYGFGRYAVYAGLAALLDPRIRGVRMERPFRSLAEWVRNPDYDPEDSLSFIVPGMLRLFDLPDMDRWLAEEGRLIGGPAIRGRNPHS
ncbi:acetylxylan esterase [Paenibacillus sp. IB182493]|uniref:Acetylxylan esterase n=2 Tax=Paenibacillus arenilitoris TaxID=2772299 RepID=A0A927H4L3_9BACL|nr:acetylxylan esterase [Paenibacillus arenilitoris]